MKFELSDLSKRVAGSEGRIEAHEARFVAVEARYERLTKVVAEVLAHSGAVQAEVLGALSRTEGEFLSLRRVVEEFDRRHGALIRDFAEFSK